MWHNVLPDRRTPLAHHVRRYQISQRWLGLRSLLTMAEASKIGHAEERHSVRDIICWTPDYWLRTWIGKCTPYWDETGSISDGGQYWDPWWICVLVLKCDILQSVIDPWYIWSMEYLEGLIDIRSGCGWDFAFVMSFVSHQTTRPKRCLDGHF
jgi:hypothetical protein